MPNIRNVQSATDDLLVGVDPARSNAPLGASLQALSNDNTSNLWWYTENVPGHAGYFWLHNAETVDVIGINPQGGIRSGSRLQSQRQANEASQWWTTVEAKEKAGYFWLKSAVDGLVIDIHKGGGIGPGSQLQVFDQKSEANQWWTWVEVPHVAATGLKGHNNYFLFGGYDKALGYIALNEVVVTITITEDLIGNPQFSFQLNCWSPTPTKQEQRTDGNNYDVWQQYGLGWDTGFGNQVGSFAENWPVNGPNLFNISPPGFWTLSDNGTNMAAGTLIMIILSQINGLTGPMSGSLVVVGNGSNAASQQINIIGQRLTKSGFATSKDLAPIAAMQMNIVAWGTPAGQPSPTTIFTKGKGTIQYFSNTPMTVLSGPPTDVAAPGTITGENSNCTYGTLPQGTSKLYVQTFGHS
jgi:hypothetical protein